MLRLTPTTARAVHAQVENLAHYCHLTAQTLGTTASLVNAQGEVLAESVAAPASVEEAVKSLRDAAIALRLLPFASLGQMQRLISLYNCAQATYAEKKELLGKLKRLRADEAQALFDEFAQELNRREAEQRGFAVAGMAYQVAA